MTRLSAGIMVYRQKTNGEVQVLLVHPGGPFYKNKDEGVWSIPKGEYANDEDAFEVAKREFTEETGNTLPDGECVQLQPVKIKSGKVISAWAIKGDFLQPLIQSNMFQIEWPPRSGKKQMFPEIDKAEWFSLKEARIKINQGQINFVEQLETLVRGNS